MDGDDEEEEQRGWVKVRWSERLTRPVIREPITYESVCTFQCTGALVNHDLKINAGMLHVRLLCLERCSEAMVPQMRFAQTWRYMSPVLCLEIRRWCMATCVNESNVAVPTSYRVTLLGSILLSAFLFHFYP